MCRLLVFVVLICYSLDQCGQIVADHTVVDRFDDIPQYYIDEVKKMWLTVPGESHSEAYRVGLTLLESVNSRFQVNVTESGTPEGYTDQHLRASRAMYVGGWLYNYGEEEWFTNTTGIGYTRGSIDYCNTHNLEISAIGFGWCWDDTYNDPSATADPVFGCRWYGGSMGGPEGPRPWGLDAADFAITGNSVCMDTYLSVTQGYADYCKSKGYKTKVFFTTGPVDTYYTAGEAGYQGSIKHQYIRDYVKKDAGRILFDYSDILCWDDNGVQTTATWNGHTFPIIAPANLGDASIGHISSAGAIRLAKAMWWMLARIAGWDGVITGFEDPSVEDSEIWTEVKEGELKVHLPGDLLSGKAELYGLDGNLKASKHIDSDLLSFNISNLSSGLYILVIRHSTGATSKKIILP